jgi:hypothetical protein
MTQTKLKSVVLAPQLADAKHWSETSMRAPLTVDTRQRTCTRNLNQFSAHQP